MKRKPLEKLSDRLVKHFLSRVKEYDTRSFVEPEFGFNGWERVSPLWFAEYMSERVMDMIREYEPEDIE